MSDLFTAVSNGKQALSAEELWVLCRVIGQEGVNLDEAKSLMEALECNDSGLTLDILTSIVDAN